MATKDKFVFESTYYPEIEAGYEILSEPFLAACGVIVNFLEMLGTIFYPVKADINGHIETVKKLVLTDKKKFKYLSAIINPAVEVPNKDKKKRAEAESSITWVKRTCEFLLHFLTSFTKPENLKNEDLRQLFRDAYDANLKMHHNIIAQKLFQVCVHAAPSRKSMVGVLTGKGDRTEAEVYRIMDVFLVNMRTNVDALKRNFDRFGKQQ